ncbi:MAG: type II secretion system protein GspM [Gemmatimonadetes bacterium]|nr:type II secretion system protein GspM [Gemmatimonadota bacterium]
MSGLRLSTRERRTITIGAIVSIAALLFAYAVLPIARRWQAREGLIAVEADRLARLRGLVAAEPDLEFAVAARTAALESGSARLLEGRTAALAASSLQMLLQDIANGSRVVVSRLDVAGAPDPADAGSPMIPATVSAIGDIYGITEMLSAIQLGPRLLEVTELTIRPNPALRGDLMQVTVKVNAAWAGAGAS